MAQPTPLTLAVGAAVAAVGLLIRGIAAGYLRKHEQLATAGPYAWTRNPLYLGSAVLAAGFLVAAASWIAAALAAAYFAVFYPAVMRREEEELRARYGAPFVDYARRVPLFWPRPPAPQAANTASDFSWEQYRKNREYQALIGSAICFFLLAFRMMWPGRWLPWG
jgi:hypothetical protein